MKFPYLVSPFPFTLCVLTALSLPCFADDAPYQLEPLVVTSGPRDTGYYNEATTTAIRILGDVLDIPYSVGVVSQILIQESLSERLEDLALFVSGVEQSSNQSGFDTDLIIRGFSTAARTYLDGVLDHPRYQVRDLALVDRVEILKGHSSVLYGSGSPGGSVNYVTKKPLAIPRHTIRTPDLSFQINSPSFQLNSLKIKGEAIFSSKNPIYSSQLLRILK